MKPKFEAGQTFNISYPFVFEHEHYRPGTVAEKYGSYIDVNGTFEEGAYYYADAVGTMVIDINSIHKPPNSKGGRNYQERIFFTRRFIHPDGTVAGNDSKLHCKALGSFTAMVNGYSHQYRITDTSKLVSAERKSSVDEAKQMLLDCLEENDD